VTETLLIYSLFALTIARLICHLKPSTLERMDVVSRAKLTEGVDSVVWAGVVALLLIHFVVRSFYIPSGSMLPTLEINDFILVNELIYDVTEPNRGDIVVFHPPPTYTGDKTDLIKRVVGVAHDKIEIVDGKLYLNDLEIQENFIKDPMLSDFGPAYVREDHVFVMGDNRNNSRDSRIIGQVPLDHLVGRAEIIFFPPARFSFFNFPR
jgi:signal peptidase I